MPSSTTASCKGRSSRARGACRFAISTRRRPTRCSPRRGRGSAHRAGIDPGEVDIWMGTLSKSLVSCGGYIAGRKDLIDYLKRMAAGFVFSVGMAPPSAAAALSALEILEQEPERVLRLNERAGLFLELAREAGL